MKPFLIAPQTPLANSGENVTLECHSEIMFDTYILTSHRMEILKETLQHFQESHFSGSYASFTIGPMTPDHSGTYTCYGAYNHSLYEWSDSSDPVDIKITGKSVYTCSLPYLQYIAGILLFGNPGRSGEQWIWGTQRKAALVSILLM